MEELTTAEKMMAEVAANMVAISEEETWKIAQPPSGPMSEVGHYHTLYKRNLRSKEIDAVQRLVDEAVYNTAAMIFALLDGRLETEAELPPLEVINKESGEALAESLHEAFLSIWEEDEEA